MLLDVLLPLAAAVVAFCGTAFLLVLAAPRLFAWQLDRTFRRIEDDLGQERDEVEGFGAAPEGDPLPAVLEGLKARLDPFTPGSSESPDGLVRALKIAPWVVALVVAAVVAYHRR